VPVGAASGLNGTSEAGATGALKGALITAVVENPSSVLSACASGLVILTGTLSWTPVGL
jgi:hypothetical protein